METFNKTIKELIPYAVKILVGPNTPEKKLLLEGIIDGVEGKQFANQKEDYITGWKLGYTKIGYLEKKASAES